MTGHLTQLGYLGLEVSDLPRWRAFAAEILGLGVSEDAAGGATLLRMDGYDRRLILVEGPADDVAFVGWQVQDRPALAAFVAHLQARGLSVIKPTSAELELRGVEQMVAFIDPLGVRNEAYFGPMMGRERFVSPKVAGCFVTGDGGLGHVVFGADDYAGALAFAAEVLGAEMTDIIAQPIGQGMKLEVSFLHLNERHHSLAYAARRGAKALHHFMIEVDRVDEVGRARDRALKHGFAVAQDIGQHSNDRMISIYLETPSGFLVEFGWGGVKVHGQDWPVVAYPSFSEWGHRPLTVPPHQPIP